MKEKVIELINFQISTSKKLLKLEEINEKNSKTIFNKVTTEKEK